MTDRPQRKVFDIVRPGKTMASPSSRPIIGRQSPVSDSQMQATGQQADDSAIPVRTVNPVGKRQMMSGRDTPTAPALPTPSGTRSKKVIAPVSLPDSEPQTPTPVPAALPVESREPTSAPALTTPGPDMPDLLLDMPDDAEPSHGFDDIDTADLEAISMKHEPNDVHEPKPQLINYQPTKVNIIARDEEQEDPLVAVDETERESGESELLRDASEAAKYQDEVNPEVDEPDYNAPIAAKHTVSRDDIMSGADMNMPNNNEEDRRPIISHHRKGHLRWWQWLLVIFFILLLAAATVNFLIDAEVLNTNLRVPHTNLL